mmetsp:Transcript_21315/g.53768  ORF Transcript_21315/g.53768 Transcript_21315/m.53768 type:complete len:224 (-) Transcript_21315:7-678(-)
MEERESHSEQILELEKKHQQERTNVERLEKEASELRDTVKQFEKKICQQPVDIGSKKSSSVQKVTEMYEARILKLTQDFKYDVNRYKKKIAELESKQWIEKPYNQPDNLEKDDEIRRLKLKLDEAKKTFAAELLKQNIPSKTELGQPSALPPSDFPLNHDHTKQNTKSLRSLEERHTPSQPLHKMIGKSTSQKICGAVRYLSSSKDQQTAFALLMRAISADQR